MFDPPDFLAAVTQGSATMYRKNGACDRAYTGIAGNCNCTNALNNRPKSPPTKIVGGSEYPQRRKDERTGAII
jgi:hypothetical protein